VWIGIFRRLSIVRLRLYHSLVALENGGFLAKYGEDPRPWVDIFLNESWPPKKQAVHTMFLAATEIVVLWEFVDHFQSFVKVRNHDPNLKNPYIAIELDCKVDIGLVRKVLLRATDCVIQHFWSSNFGKCLKMP
jgi:hypothetical protein